MQIPSHLFLIFLIHDKFFLIIYLSNFLTQIFMSFQIGMHFQRRTRNFVCWLIVIGHKNGSHNTPNLTLFVTGEDRND